MPEALDISETLDMSKTSEIGRGCTKDYKRRRIMAEKQRVYNVIRKAEYCPINETTVNVSTFSTRAAAKDND